MSEPAMAKLSLEAPFLFTGALWIFLLPVMAGGALVHGASVAGVPSMVFAVGLVAFCIAAAYVALIDGVLYLLYRAGLVRRETAVEV